jgi:hypothetical protein
MTEETKRVNVERDPAPEEKSEEGVVNDSLGSVDPADSTGLDGVDPTGGDKPSQKSGKAQDNA